MKIVGFIQRCKICNVRKMIILVLSVLLTAGISFIAFSAESFDLTGEWEQTWGSDTGAAPWSLQNGRTVTFDGSHCGLWSPYDSYTIYDVTADGFTLDIKGLIGGNPIYYVQIIDRNHIEIYLDSTLTFRFERTTFLEEDSSSTGGSSDANDSSNTEDSSNTDDSLNESDSSEETLSTITISYNGGEDDVLWGSSLFAGNSSSYNKDLALLSIVLSTAAYDGENTDGRNIANAYHSLGFEEDNISLYSYPENSLNRSNVKGMNDEDLAFSIAGQELKGTPIVVITLRGTYAKWNHLGDAMKDISAGSTDFYGVNAHDGFYDFYESVSLGLKDYKENHPQFFEQKDELKILVTGHSLGAAGANITGVWLNQEDYAKKNNIYVYTFAAPNTYFGDVTKVGNCDNIFNICSTHDSVTAVPFRTGILFDTGDPWSKFGNTLWFSDGEEDIFQSHNLWNYISAVRRYENGVADNKVSVINAYSVGCPVDLYLYDNTDRLVCRIENDEVDYENSGVTAFVQGETKVIMLTEDEKDYTLKFSATDSGTMNYSVQTYDPEDGKVVAANDYTSIALEKGKTFTSMIGSSVEPEEVELYVTDKNEERIAEVSTDGKEIETKSNSAVEEETEDVSAGAKKILLIVIGVIAGIAVLIGLILFILEIRRRRQWGIR